MDNFLRCDNVVSLTARLVDGAVEPDRRELVEMHLLVCPACLAHLGKVRDLRAFLGDLPGQHPGPGAQQIPADLLTLATNAGRAATDRTDG
ncbi:zf-HC2 domain-containing protein [Solwaraspora sp. WMMD1047]|uniref:anti-sigma factor family protein n=1 Tax=Solwaraspora sp. WMMD1047 TaxID=3016102 RepID=UPI002417CC65|nr:zf-HC2 domain-containing protein [Solwaraspora sp. WMMD1047]MDG4827854.1 zf-HC2 domain-containing protein [Solwaraspora sp. WMMD1047]